MKRFALFFSLFMLCLVVKANPVSRSQALKEAKSFLASKGVEMNTSDAAYRAPRKANAQEGESSYYYIFNVGNDEGFVIVSGDDRTEQILGYSDSGSFDEENMPEPLKEWLDGYAKEMESIIEVDANEYESLSPRRAQEKTKKSIAPLTTAKYGSGYPYTTNLTRYAVGCAPVAISILLHYYKNDISKSSSYGSKIVWNNLLDVYYDLPSKNYTSVQLTAVANLMKYTGLALSTDANGGTKVSSQIPGLRDYYAFDKNMTLVDRTYYNVEDWENIIYQELACKRPVVYNAYDNGYTVGHTLIVDGYDNSGLFHINWGWDGQFNGYFRLSALYRYEAGANGSLNVNNTFCMPRYHSALLYSVPNSYGNVNTSNNILSAEITSATNATITCTYKNESCISGAYSYGVGCIKDGEVIFLKSPNTVSTLLNTQKLTGKSITLTYSDFSSVGLSEGNYVVVPMYKFSGDSDWKVCQFNKDNKVYAKYYNKSITLSLSSEANLVVDDINLEGNGLVKKEQRIKARIVNNSNNGYSGNLYFFASTTTTKEAQSSAILNLGKNESIIVDFPFTPSTAGTYNIWISTDVNGNNVINKAKKITILGKTEPSLNITNVKTKINKNYAGLVNNCDIVYGNTLDLTVTGLKNDGSYPISASFVVWLRKWDSLKSTKWNSKRFGEKGDNGIAKVVNFVIPAKSTKDISIIFDDVTVNDKYDVRVEYNWDVYGYNTKITLTNPIIFYPGVTTWKADGTSTSVKPTSTVTIGSDVVAVDITDADTVKTITPNSNPNILYYLGANQKVPTGLTNKNVVKGDVAEMITLVDNKNFFVPKRFTAKSINFTTQPKKGVSRGNNNNWTTIALPFEVTSVRNTTDNEIIDWFHSDTDTGKNFWIRKFDRLDTSDNTVIFENAEKMLAYEPYIMNVPDDYWGKKWDLRNKNITFYGENAVLHNEANIGTNSSYYNFVGTTLTKNVDNGWLLNDAGDTFKYVISGTKGTSTIVSPFHAYFMLTSDFYDGSSANSAKSSLKIKFDGDEDSTTGIMAPFAAAEKVVDVYNLNGVKVASKNMKNGSVDMSDLPKGIYVVNGKKFIQY